VDEDMLSPLLGRLIDEAKAAARTDMSPQPLEAVALLLEDETIVSAYASLGGADPHSSAGDAALAKACGAGAQEVAAAAVALSGESRQSVFPSDETRRALVAVNADLPLVVKQRGRWIMKPISQLPLQP
jgi:hypothetical protein